ncbi:MAG: ABC transporter permease, partial [Chitinophagaceae bacterium]
MFRNYLRITLRNLRKHKAYSLINIAGLTIGMACSILILLWVQNEKSYDRFHTNANRIYRITCNASEFKAAVNPAAMPDGLKREIPGIKNFVRFTHLTTTLFEAGEKKFEEKNTFYVDSTLDKVFSFEFKAGNKATALDRPDAVLITEAMATKYFGKENPLGKTLKRNNSDFVTVTGVLKNIPANSHIQFDFLMPMSAIAQQDGDLKENRWGNFNFYSYLLLEKQLTEKSAEKANFEKKMDAIFQKHQEGFKVKFQLQPLTDIHLYSNLQVDLAGHGNVQYLNIFMVVAIFILVVACINFMNLATARSARRAREVGIRKVAGALRLQLIMQFIGESLIISIISLLMAIG